MYTEGGGITPVLVLHWFTGGRAWYRYTYTATATGGSLVTGSWNVPVTLDFTTTDGLRVTRVLETP